MIDTKELRRLAQDQQWIGRWYDAGCETLMAERDGEHEEVAHPMPIGLVPYLVAVQPAAITELIDRLEAAEKAVTEAYQRGYATGQGEIEKERDALRARIEQMERQEPVAVVESWTNGSYSRNYKLQWLRDVNEGARLYALPGAQGE